MLTKNQPGSMYFVSARRGATSYRFANPVESITAFTHDELILLFNKLNDAKKQGLYAAGYVAYEAGYALEASLTHHLPTNGHPLAHFSFYADRTEFTYEPDAGVMETPAPEIRISRGEYQQKINLIKSHIERGDTYQLNLTTTLQWQNTVSANHLLDHVLSAQPVEFGALLNLPDLQIISASPELFFRRSGQRITTKPMKGTARRGLSLAEDKLQAAWLAQDEKNRAENLMIVDLLRNDLGRICKIGSIHVDSLFNVETYSTLHQMTSTISGTLRQSTSWQQIFGALFPSGSIVGAPKIKSMQLLHQLEQVPRGVYTGCIGFITPDDEAVFSVAIRTITLQNQQASMGIGSGITYDSDAATEYEECLLKANFLHKNAEPFQLIETMLWDGSGFHFLAEHLARLESSADYFAFTCNRDAITHSLQRHVEAISKPHRVRLLLFADGATSITSAPVERSDRLIRVMISQHRTRRDDLFLHHKTTRRRLYDSEFALAQQLGFDEVLFLNTDGQLTEGAISNLFVDRDGRMLTPPLKDGVLAGVLRNHLQTQEQSMTLADLLPTDTLYLGNSVRGLRKIGLLQNGEEIACSAT